MCKQGCQGISQTGMFNNKIIPIVNEASSLPSGWNLASSTTALFAVNNPMVRKFFKVRKY